MKKTEQAKNKHWSIVTPVKILRVISNVRLKQEQDIEQRRSEMG